VETLGDCPTACERQRFTSVRYVRHGVAHSTASSRQDAANVARVRVAALADAGQHLQVVVGYFASSEKVVRLREVPARIRHLYIGKRRHADSADGAQGSQRLHSFWQGA
jgi:hypothetical protein